MSIKSILEKNNNLKHVKYSSAKIHYQTNKINYPFNNNNFYPIQYWNTMGLQGSIWCVRCTEQNTMD